MTKKLHLFLTMLLCAVSTVSWADTTDELTRDWIGITGTSYADWSDKTLASGAIYAGNSAGGNESIQLRSKSGSGIITTGSGGKIKSIKLSWNENTAEERKLDVYGSNEPYSSTSDLYDNAKKGTLLGSIEMGDDNALTIEGDYAFIGIRSNNGAIWLNKIEIVWAASSDTKKTATVTIDKTSLEVGESATVTTDGPNVTLTTSDASVATVSGNKVTGKSGGSATITATWDANNDFYGGSKDFIITVNAAPGEYATVELPYSVDFTKAQDKFVIEDISNPYNIEVWTQGKTYGMTATAFVKLADESSKTNHESESWLISPIIDLSKATKATLTFSDNWNGYFSNFENDFGVYIREKGGQWQKIDLTYEKPESGYHGWDDKEVDLTSYAGKQIQVGYKYSSTNESAGTYEVKNFTIAEGEIITKKEAGLKFDVSNFTAIIGDENEFPVLDNPNNLPVVYSSTNEEYATIDSSTGTITLITAGQTTIKATFEGNDEFEAGSASYLLVVKEKAIAGNDVYELVSDASTLAANDKIIIVNEENTHAISTTQNNNNRAATEVALEADGTIIPSNQVQIITLEGEEGKWYFNVGEGYLCAPGQGTSGNNYLRTQDEADLKAQASITITEGVSEVKFNQWTENARTLLRYNKNNGIPIFSCYAPTATTGTPLRIYKKATPSGKLLGDVNGDGKINMMDVTAVINYILGKSPSPFIYENACMNDDPYINMQDVTAIINIILGIK